MSITSVNQEHQYAPRTRPAGQVVDADVPHQIMPWVIVITNPAVSATGYDLRYNGLAMDMIEEVRLIAVSAEVADTRRIIVRGPSNDSLLNDMHSHSIENINNTMIVTPGLNLGPGLVVKHSRDARIKIPNTINVTQQNLDGTAFAGDHRIRLYFNLKMHRFQ